MAEKQDFKPVKVKIKSGKQKSMKYISGDLLYSGVNLFGKLSEIYLEKIKNGEMFTGSFTQEVSSKEQSNSSDYSTPGLSKKSSTMSNSSTASVAPNSMLKGSKIFQMDQEIMSLFRKLQKKDAVTKVKALRALQMYVQKHGLEQTDGFDIAEPGSELSQALTFFLYHFERIITYEIEKSVREAAHDVLGEFLIVCKRNFATHIINLFPLWYISFYDTALEIRNKAKNNFMKTFKTPEIRSSLFRKTVENVGALQADSETTIAQNYLYFIQEKITHFEMLLTEDMTSLDKPQRDSIYDRIIAGCLESLCDSFDTFASLSEGQKEKSWESEHTQQYIEQLNDVFSLNSKENFPAIYKFMGAKYNSPVRAAALKLVEKMSNYMISFDSNNKDIYLHHLHKLCNSLFAALADESSQVQKVIWKSVLFNICTQFKDNIWEQVDMKKGLLPQLNTCLKNAGYGAHSDLYHNFVAIVSILPIFDFTQPLETKYKIEVSRGKKKQIEEREETKEGEGEEENVDTDKKSKKNKQKKNKEKADGGGEKLVKNSFSISEKLNVMYEIMKSHFSGLDVEEAVAFNDEVINSYFETMSYLYLKRIIPAMDIFIQSNDQKNNEQLVKKSTQCFMLPITEYLKRNDPKMHRSLFNIIPVKFSQTLTLFADKGIDVTKLQAIFDDISETLAIGLERAPHNAIKVLSALLISIPHHNVYYSKIQNIGSHVIQRLYKNISEGVNSMSKDTIDKFEKDIEIFSYIAHNLLTTNLTSQIFELGPDEKTDDRVTPYEFSILRSLLEIVQMLKAKLKAEFLQKLEIIQEKLWLCLILRMNYLCQRDSQDAKQFMDNDMLEFIFESIKDYEIDDDRYLRFVIQYISPSDCLSVLISENIERKPDPRKFKKAVLNKRDTRLDEIFTPYEDFIRNSEKIQDNCLKIFYIDMIDYYCKSHQILTVYSIMQRKIEEYVNFKEGKIKYTIFTDDTIKCILESTLEYLSEIDKVHKSFQLSELNGVLSKLLLSIKKEDGSFDVCDKLCKRFFQILLTMQQNLSSSLELWKFISKVLSSDQLNKDNTFLHYIEDVMKGRIHRLSEISNYQEHEFNNEILVLRNFSNSIPRDKVKLIECLSRIILHEDNFSSLAKNCLILKIFQQTFLTGGLGFNIDDLALQKDENGSFKYIWILCELLTANYLPSLAGYTHLRNQIQMFCESEVVPLILRECCSESNSTLFFSMILYLTEKSITKSSLYAKTLENILRMLITPPEGLYELVADFNRWKDLLSVTISTHLDSVLTADTPNEPSTRRRIELIKTVSRSTSELLGSLECFQEIRQKVVSNLDVKTQTHLILYSVLSDSSRWDSKALRLMDEQPEVKDALYYDVMAMQRILQYVATLLSKEIGDFGIMDAVLESLNCAITKMGIGNMMDGFGITYENVQIFLKNSLEYLIVEESTIDNKEEEKEETDSNKSAILLNTIGVNLLQFIKMMIGYLHTNDSSSSSSILDGVLEYSKIKAEAFNYKMDLLKENIKETQKTKYKPHQPIQEHLSDYSKQIQEQEYEVIECISEVLNTLTPYVHQNMEEDTLYSLVSTHIENIQKSAYLTLVQFYENFIPPIKYEYEVEELDEEEFKQRVEREMQLNEQEETKAHTQHTQVEVLKHKRIKGEPDKNVSVMMLDIIEKAPSFKEEQGHQNEEVEKEDSEDEIVHEGYMNIQSASTLLDDKIMSSEVYSYFLAWNAMLNKIANAKMKLKFEQDHDYLRVINSLQEFLTLNQHVYEMFLIILVAYLPTKISKTWTPSTIIDCKPEWVDLNDQKLIEEFALYSMYNFMTNFPSLAREYYQDCDKRIHEIVYPIIKKLISPAIMENEIRKIEISQASLNTQNLSFTLFKSTKEILADYVDGEVEVQLRLKIPNEYPLKGIEVKCTKQLKIPEMKLKRWMLSISKMISSQNGDFISGILLWKSNIEKEVEGVEDCLICYSTVHVIDKSLPRLACKNCKNKFHAHCIKKWFSESQKSKCPMCQSYFW